MENRETLTKKLKSSLKSNPTAFVISAEEALCLALKIGKVMAKGGSTAKRTDDTVTRFLENLGYDNATILVGIHSLTISLQDRNGTWLTRASEMSGGVHLGAVVEASRFVALVKVSSKSFEDLHDELDGLLELPHYGKYVTCFQMGITCCCICLLIGGDFWSIPAVFLSTTIGMLIRKTAEEEKINIYINWFITAYVTATISLLITGHCVQTETVLRATLSPTLMLVPGVPIVNTVLDLVRRYSDTGVARLAFLLVLIAVHGHGVVLACMQFGLLQSDKPLALEPAATTAITRLDPLQNALADMVLSGVASFGFALLFQVPRKLLLVSSLIGCIAHSAKTLGMRYVTVYTGLVDFGATALMCLVAEAVSKYLFPKQRIPGVVLYVPGLVLMMPGLFLIEGILQHMWIVQVHAQYMNNLVVLEHAFFTGFVNFFRAGLIVGGVGIGVAVGTLIYRPKNERLFFQEEPPTRATTAHF